MSACLELARILVAQIQKPVGLGRPPPQFLEGVFRIGRTIEPQHGFIDELSRPFCCGIGRKILGLGGIAGRRSKKSGQGVCLLDVPRVFQQHDTLQPSERAHLFDAGTGRRLAA